MSTAEATDLNKPRFRKRVLLFPALIALLVMGTAICNQISWTEAPVEMAQWEIRPSTPDGIEAGRKYVAAITGTSTQEAFMDTMAELVNVPQWDFASDSVPLGRAKQMAKSAIIQAQGDLQSGDTRKAIAKIVVIMKIGNHLADYPSLGTILLGAQMTDLALEFIEKNPSIVSAPISFELTRSVGQALRLRAALRGEGIGRLIWLCQHDRAGEWLPPAKYISYKYLTNRNHIKTDTLTWTRCISRKEDSSEWANETRLKNWLTCQWAMALFFHPTIPNPHPLVDNFDQRDARILTLLKE